MPLFAKKIVVATPLGVATTILMMCVVDGLQRDSLIGANLGASTALNAQICVDNINITGRDSLYGALANAATASYTFLRINFVSHNYYLLKKFNVILVGQI